MLAPQGALSIPDNIVVTGAVRLIPVAGCMLPDHAWLIVRGGGGVGVDLRLAGGVEHRLHLCPTLVAPLLENFPLAGLAGECLTVRGVLVEVERFGGEVTVPDGLLLGERGAVRVGGLLVRLGQAQADSVDLDLALLAGEVGAGEGHVRLVLGGLGDLDEVAVPILDEEVVVVQVGLDLLGGHGGHFAALAWGVDLAVAALDRHLVGAEPAPEVEAAILEQAQAVGHRVVLTVLDDGLAVCLRVGDGQFRHVLLLRLLGVPLLPAAILGGFLEGHLEILRVEPAGIQFLCERVDLALAVDLGELVHTLGVPLGLGDHEGGDLIVGQVLDVALECRVGGVNLGDGQGAAAGLLLLLPFGLLFRLLGLLRSLGLGLLGGLLGGLLLLLGLAFGRGLGLSVLLGLLLVGEFHLRGRGGLRLGGVGVEVGLAAGVASVCFVTEVVDPDEVTHFVTSAGDLRVAAGHLLVSLRADEAAAFQLVQIGEDLPAGQAGFFHDLTGGEGFAGDDVVVDLEGPILGLEAGVAAVVLLVGVGVGDLADGTHRVLGLVLQVLERVGTGGFAGALLCEVDAVTAEQVGSDVVEHLPALIDLLVSAGDAVGGADLLVDLGLGPPTLGELLAGVERSRAHRVDGLLRRRLRGVPTYATDGDVVVVGAGTGVGDVTILGELVDVSPSEGVGIVPLTVDRGGDYVLTHTDDGFIAVGGGDGITWAGLLRGDVSARQGARILRDVGGGGVALIRAVEALE